MKFSSKGKSKVRARLNALGHTLFTLNDLLHQLNLINFTSYLSSKEVFSLSCVSRDCHLLVHDYICENFTFQLGYHRELNIYVQARNILLQYELLDKWPPLISKLILGDGFNQALFGLPSTITHLEIGSSFNQILHPLPDSITYLQIGDGFNQPIDNCLPPNLVHLDIGNKFYRNVSNLPTTITHLNIGWGFYIPFNKIPPHLTSLKIKGIFLCSCGFDGVPFD